MIRTYPPTLAEVREVLFDFQGLAKMSDATVQRAMDTAQGEIETANSWAANPSLLSPHLNRSLWALCIDLIIWRLRYNVERDPDSNDVPKFLQTLRSELVSRIKALNIETPAETNRYMVSAFDPLAAPDLPTSNRSY